MQPTESLAAGFHRCSRTSLHKTYRLIHDDGLELMVQVSFSD